MIFNAFNRGVIDALGDPFGGAGSVGAFSLSMSADDINVTLNSRIEWDQIGQTTGLGVTLDAVTNPGRFTLPSGLWLITWSARFAVANGSGATRLYDVDGAANAVDITGADWMRQAFTDEASRSYSNNPTNLGIIEVTTATEYECRVVSDTNVTQVQADFSRLFGIRLASSL